MRKKNIRICLAVALLPASSCAATKCDDYRHIEVGPLTNLSVVEKRVPALSGLREVQPFPVLYTLKRSNYQIVVRVYEKDYGATATLTVDAPIPMTLRNIEGYAGSSCVVSVEQNGGVKFSWLGKAGCAEKQNIQFSVVDTIGAKVAIENMPFAVVTNGRYCVKDSL